MWSVETAFATDEPITLTLDLGPEPVTLGALKVWNYNASLEESYQGVKRMALSLDGALLSPPGGFLIRKAPGNARCGNQPLGLVHLKYSYLGRISTDLAHSWTRRELRASPRRPPRSCRVGKRTLKGKPTAQVKPDGAVNEAQQQVAFSDKILLNKVDLVTPDELAVIRKRLRAINQFAEVRGGVFPRRAPWGT